MRIFLAKSLILLFVLTLLIAAFRCSSSEPEFDCPDFQLRDLDGNIVEFHKLLEEGPVFFTIWALWCKMTIKSLDTLNPYYSEFTSYGMHMLAISQDKLRAIPEVKPFVETHEWGYTVLLDPENRIRELFNIQAFPTFFVYDQYGELVFEHVGYKPGDEQIIIDTLRALYGNQ
jgi:cytochrome c biogenesis protein CcmG/thiol:disulfide interchange protein DsbE